MTQTPESGPRSRPLVFAHRGASASAPEHTLAAYRRALAEGVDGVECDVRLTVDGHLVCVHDRQLNRTSNGRGHVSSRTLAELERLDFGSWHPSAAGTSHQGAAAPAATVGELEPPDAEYYTEPDLVTEPDEARSILTLDRLIVTLLAAAGPEKPVRLLIETKHPTRYGNRVEVALVKLLRRYGLDRPRPGAPLLVSVMSFSPRAVRVVRRLAPDLPTVLLMDFIPPGLLRGRRLPFDAHMAGPALRVIRSRPSVVRRLRALGSPIYVWTVNEPVDVDLMVRLGVDGIISDRPGSVLAHIGR